MRTTKEREEREARKRQADAEAAQIYAKFVASFEDEDATLGKAFVRAGSADGAADKRTDLYRLKPKTAAPSGVFGSTHSAFSSSSSNSSIDSAATTVRAPGKKMSEMERMFEEMKQKEADRHGHAGDASSSSFAAGPPKKKRREIDQFLEELKERCDSVDAWMQIQVCTEGTDTHCTDREPVAPTMDEMGLGKGSFDHGDPDTTNLYVGNLAPTVTEETLEVRSRGRNCRDTVPCLHRVTWVRR